MLGLTAAGDGPAVLWLHGYTMDSTVWQRLWQLLPGWRHVGVDLPGHGGSDPLAPGTTLTDVAAEVAEVARREQAERVVALSFGSCIALQLAADAPELVRSLVVAAPTVAGAPPEPGTGDRYRELAMLMLSGAAPEQVADRWMTSPPDIFRGTEEHPQLRASLREVIGRHSWAELRTGAMAGLARQVHTDEVLRRITADTLVVIGDADMPTFVDNADRLAATLDRCTVHPMERAGHLCLLERPDAIAPALAAHLCRDTPAVGAAAPAASSEPTGEGR